MNNHWTLLVLLDMSAAFDTLNHDALINRLFAIGFRTKSLSLLKSYIEIRFSEVTIGSDTQNHVSTHAEYPKAQYLDRFYLISTYLQFLKYS